MKIYTEPFWWSLFGAGGVISAFCLPILLVYFGIMVPLEWVEVPSYEYIHELVNPLLVRFGILVLISLSMIHWAHRFRFTLHEGLQLHKYSTIIAYLCYGSAIVVSLFSAYSLWNF